MLVNDLLDLEYFFRLESVLFGFDGDLVLEFGRGEVGRGEFVFWLLIVSIFSSDIDDLVFKLIELVYFFELVYVNDLNCILDFNIVVEFFIFVVRKWVVDFVFIFVDIFYVVDNEILL